MLTVIDAANSRSRELGINEDKFVVPTDRGCRWTKYIEAVEIQSYLANICIYDLYFCCTRYWRRGGIWEAGVCDYG